LIRVARRMTGTLSQMVAQVANAVPLPLGIEVFASVFHAATGEAPLALGDPQHGWQDDPERRARGADENAAGAVADAPAASRGSPMDATAPAVVFYEGESDGDEEAEVQERESDLVPKEGEEAGRGGEEGQDREEGLALKQEQEAGASQAHSGGDKSSPAAASQLTPAAISPRVAGGARQQQGQGSVASPGAGRRAPGTPRAIREGILTPAVESWIEFGLSSVTEVEKKAGGLGLKVSAQGWPQKGGDVAPASCVPLVRGWLGGLDSCVSGEVHAAMVLTVPCLLHARHPRGLQSVTSVMEEVEEKLLEMGESPDLSGVRTRIEAMLDSRRGLKRSIKRTAENA
jgi:hypothetical protein